MGAGWSLSQLRVDEGRAQPWMSSQLLAGPYVSNCGFEPLLTGTSALL